ncbi:helix-turn-helix transcriptional regulator, partial [Prevotella copri]|uniref:helix-turn-helix domain-containing protein n=1 Tax=Segatella copri TaxID=165179 RepID=UPI001F259C69
MIQNKLFRDCLAAIPAEQKAEFDLSFGIAERISEILKAKGLTQKDFARLLNKRDTEISKWLTGRHNFTTQTIARIETALGSKLIVSIRSTPYCKSQNNVVPLHGGIIF